MGRSGHPTSIDRPEAKPMHTIRRPIALTALALALACAVPALAATPIAQADGEYSKTAPAAAMRWRAPGIPAANVARMQYGEMAVSRLLELQRKNQAPGLKATQIGIGRYAAQESAQSGLPALQWQAVAGGFVAKVEIRSMDAMALRVGLDVSGVHDRAELRFGGSARPAEVVATMTGAEMKRLPGPEGLFWSPNTDGETQIVEIFRPKGVPAFAVRLEAPVLSHLIADSRNSFKVIEKIGESGTCNVDTICRVNELGQGYVNAKNAVAHMRYVRGTSTFICTGTLLADTVPETQTPYFHGANHCFTTNTNLPPVATQMQTVANTLNTFWNYETTGCGNLVQSATTQLGGGAAYLYSSNATDGMLLRLNNAPPSFAYFAGWNAAPMTTGNTPPIPSATTTNILAIHHPAGDSKQVSGGQWISQDSTQTTVGWLTGTTEGGSSGSGLFTLNARGQYVLRGGLFGGSASCANFGSIGNASNRDFYSRLDVDFASMKTWLEPQPAGANGNKPLIRARSASASRQPTAAPAATRTRRAVERDGSQRGK
jgi:hypothetical protein